MDPIFYEKRLKEAIEVKTETWCDFSLAADKELSDRSNIFKQPGCLGMFNSFPERPAFSEIWGIISTTVQLQEAL